MLSLCISPIKPRMTRKAEVPEEQPSNPLNIKSVIKSYMTALPEKPDQLRLYHLPKLKEFQEISKNLLASGIQDEELANLCSSLEDRIKKVKEDEECIVANFEDYLPRDISNEIAVMLQWEDRIEHVMHLPPKATLSRVQAMNQNDIKEFAERIAKEEDRFRKAFDISEFFSHASLDQQEKFCDSCMMQDLKNLWELFELLPKDLDKLYLNLHMFGHHPKFLKIFNGFSNLKTLKVFAEDFVAPSESPSIFNHYCRTGVIGTNNEYVLKSLVKAKNLSQLEKLDLSKCRIEDLDIKKLIENESLLNLKELKLGELTLSKTNERRLKNKFPNIVVENVAPEIGNIWAD